jgi:hypothetical protein
VRARGSEGSSSNALGVNTPPRTPNDPIRPSAVSLDHLQGFLPIAYAHHAIVGVLHADGVRGLIETFGGASFKNVQPARMSAGHIMEIIRMSLRSDLPRASVGIKSSAW